MPATDAMAPRQLLFCALLFALAAANPRRQKARPGVRCAIEHGLFCGYCLRAANYLDCQRLLFGKKEKLRVPRWAADDPVRFIRDVGVDGQHVAACAGFVSYLMRDLVCTPGMNRRQLEAEGFAREAAQDFEPAGGDLYAMRGMVEWMPPGEDEQDENATSVRLPVAARKKGKGTATPSARQRFTTNINFASRKVVHQQFYNMLHRTFPGSCPKPSVKVVKVGSGWQTAIACRRAK